MLKDFSTLNTDELRIEYSELAKKNSSTIEQYEEIMKFSEICVVECTEHLYIIKVYGAYEAVFKKIHTYLKNGTELIKPIFKMMQEKKDADEDAITSDLKNLEKSIHAFIKGSKTEEEFKIASENENGESFALVWKIIKIGNILRCLFKKDVSNSIVNTVKLKFQNDLENQKAVINNFINILNEGVTLLDTKGRIKMMSKKAKEHFFAGSVKILQNAPVEGRFFREIFTNEPTDEINKRMDYNNSVTSSGVSVSYTKMSHGKNLEFEIFPSFEGNNEVSNGLIIFTRLQEKNIEEIESVNRKLQSLVQLIKNENGTLKERINELELNQGWLMKKMNEVTVNSKLLHETVLQLYGYLDIIPYPLAVINVPSLRYEFVNKSFVKFLNRDKREILGKKDEDILTSDTAFELSLKLMDTLSKVSHIDINIYGNPGIQYGFALKSAEPSHIIRILNKMGL
jgi:hypothetical protein